MPADNANRPMKPLLILPVLLTWLLSGCPANPVDAKKHADDSYTLTYQKRSIDRIDRMRRELLLKAEEVCRGNFEAVREYPDPTALRIPPSMMLHWDIRCIT